MRARSLAVCAGAALPVRNARVAWRGAALRCAELGRQCWAEQCCVLCAEGWGKGAINVNMMEGHTNPVFILY